MSALQYVAILGATGSIGRSTLDVVARHPDRFRAFALTAHTQADELCELAIRHRPRFAVLADDAQARDLRAARRSRLRGGGLPGRKPWFPSRLTRTSTR
jgi:1-deoxy-D-xylulose-5-phosphate reductoisomerase